MCEWRGCEFACSRARQEESLVVCDDTCRELQQKYAEVKCFMFHNLTTSTGLHHPNEPRFQQVERSYGDTLIPSADGAALTGGLMEDATARWRSVMVVLGQSGTEIRPVPAYLTCAAECETAIDPFPTPQKLPIAPVGMCRLVYLPAGKGTLTFP
ncbi:hypothetical protein NFI96_003904 [Prochilodus magdalenae]|nr:hypothetical protein NFI96_003904 [Prochilodus magdalenae]